MENHELENLINEFNQNTKLTKEMHESLIGNELKGESGWLSKIKQNSEDIKTIKDQIMDIKAPWRKVGVAGTISALIGTLIGSVTNWSEILKSILSWI